MGGTHFKKNERGSVSISGSSPKRMSVELLNTSLLLKKLETGQRIPKSCWHDSKLKCLHESVVSLVCGHFRGWVFAPCPCPRTSHRAL